MAEFLTEHKLNEAISQIFKSAEKQIFVLSPYIKFHSRIRDILLDIKENPKVELIIVFGKNEEDITKSLFKDDFLFLQEFPNIQIRYEERLHAKYYANESSGVLSSMNLYDFSQNNNIEFGIRSEVGFLESITGKSLDSEAFEYFNGVIKKSKLMFERIPVYDSKLMGLQKVYTNSVTQKDDLSSLFVVSKKASKPTKTSSSSKGGYCIRTGEPIPFNIKRPFCDKAFESWNRYKDEDYKEKYCHFSGEKSNGETSYSRPILKKNWKKAMAK